MCAITCVIITNFKSLCWIGYINYSETFPIICYISITSVYGYTPCITACVKVTGFKRIRGIRNINHP